MVSEILVYQERIASTIDTLGQEVLAIARTVSQNSSIAFRIKDPETLKKKMLLKKVRSVFSVDDVYGIRIIVESVSQVYAILEKVSQTFPGHLDHDYIKEPKVNPEGKMLRLVQFIAYKNGVPFEIQVTTSAFHEVNEPLHEGYHRRKYHS